jgi:hypothetical protein
VHDYAFFISIIDDRFAHQVLFFQDILIFQSAIALCYNTQFMALQSCVLSPRIQVVCEAMVKFLSLIVNSCVLNQNQGHWLLLVVFTICYI